MLSLETIMNETIWVGKFNEGGRIAGTYDKLSDMRYEFRDFDIAARQPEHLKEFYEGYFSQHEYFFIQDYYNNVYSKLLNEEVN